MKKNVKTMSQTEKSSILFWLMMSFAVFFLLKTPFDTALFNGYTIQYETPIYSLQLLTAMVMILMCFFLYFRWKGEDSRILLSILVWLIPLTYLIASINAASAHYAKNMLFLHLTYASFFLIGAHMAKDELGARLLQLAVTLSGYIVVIYGLLNLNGNAYFRDAVMLDQGLRLTSVFQYANAYAAFLIAVLLCCLHYIMTTRKWYFVALHALMLVPIVISFWLTLSRGAIVVLPFIFLAALPFIPISRQIMWILYVIISLPLSFLIMNKTTGNSLEIYKIVTASLTTVGKPTLLNITNPKSISNWGLLLGASSIAVIVVVAAQKWLHPFLEKKLAKTTEKKFSRFLLPVVAIVVGGSLVVLVFGNTGIVKLLPDFLQKRIESINFQQHSVLERGTFYKDSLKLVKDYPIFGAGGGGWAALYEKYQNNPYVSRQAHNFFLQYLVEVGIVGFIVFMVFLGMVFYFFIRKHFSLGRDKQDSHLIFYFVTIALLIHSILDFEMSYVFLAALVFLCLGGMASIADQPIAWLKRLGERSYVKYAYVGAISVVSIVFLIMSVIMFNANRLYASAMPKGNENKSLTEVLEFVEKALKLQPNHPYYLLSKAELLAQGYSQSKNESFYEEWKKTIQYAKQKEPNVRQIIESEYQLYMVKAQYEEAAGLMKEAITQYPWDITLYERAIAVNVESWNRARQNKNLSDTIDQYEKTVYELYNAVAAKTKELEKLPKGQLQGRPFSITPSVSFPVGQMEYIKGNIKEAIELLRPAASSVQIDQQLQPEELDRQKQYVRWYLAALKKQNQNDQALYDRFVAKFPNERQEIDSLANAKF